MKSIVLLSGGLDSTVLLATRHSVGDDITALSLSYGQRHIKELQAAEKIATWYKVPHIKMDLAEVFRFDVNSCALLAASAQTLPMGMYRPDGIQPTYVPYRNGIFLSVAISLALQLNCEAVFYGAHHDDAVGNAYPDCSIEFVRAQSEAASFGTGGKVNVYAPFVTWTKADIVAQGINVYAPLALTWSCYAGGEFPCGKCGTCIDRAKAFAANSVSDPALYAQHESEVTNSEK